MQEAVHERLAALLGLFLAAGLLHGEGRVIGGDELVLAALGVVVVQKDRVEQVKCAAKPNEAPMSTQNTMILGVVSIFVIKMAPPLSMAVHRYMSSTAWRWL